MYCTIHTPPNPETRNGPSPSGLQFPYFLLVESDHVFEPDSYDISGVFHRLYNLMDPR